jgi:hypothetical protein
MVWLEFYFLFIKFPPKFKRTGSAYILVSFFLFYLFFCVCTEPWMKDKGTDEEVTDEEWKTMCKDHR